VIVVTGTVFALEERDRVVNPQEIRSVFVLPLIGAKQLLLFTNTISISVFDLMTHHSNNAD